MSNRLIVEHETAKRESAIIINVARNAMNISKYNDNNDEDYSTSDNNYSASQDRMLKLRINYEDSSSNNNSDNNSVSTGGYEYESNSDDGYVDELSDSDDKQDQMPDLCMNLDNDSSVNNSDDETVSAGGYNYKSASDNKLDSSNNKSISNNSGWAWEARAQDLEAAKIRRYREHRQRSAIIQDIYARGTDENNAQLTKPPH